MFSATAVGLAGSVRADAPRASSVEMLGNAVTRLGEVSSQSVSTAMKLAGAWPVNGDASGEVRHSDGVFDNIEGFAQIIHRICDDLAEANAAVTRRL